MNPRKGVCLSKKMVEKNTDPKISDKLVTATVPSNLGCADLKGIEATATQSFRTNVKKSDVKTAPIQRVPVIGLADRLAVQAFEPVARYSRTKPQKVNVVASKIRAIQTSLVTNVY